MIFILRSRFETEFIRSWFTGASDLQEEQRRLQVLMKEEERKQRLAEEEEAKRKLQDKREQKQRLEKLERKEEQQVEQRQHPTEQKPNAAGDGAKSGAEVDAEAQRVLMNLRSALALTKAVATPAAVGDEPSSSSKRLKAREKRVSPSVSPIIRREAHSSSPVQPASSYRSLQFFTDVNSRQPSVHGSYEDLQQYLMQRPAKGKGTPGKLPPIGSTPLSHDVLISELNRKASKAPAAARAEKKSPVKSLDAELDGFIAEVHKRIGTNSRSR